MAKLTWNLFTAKHLSPFGFAAAISSTLPNGPHFDKSRKKLPTPYGLFQEWAASSFSDDWSSMKFKGGFIICVESKSDATLISQKFGTIGPAKKTPACANTVQVNYKDSDYVNLAKKIGYNF